MDRGTVMKTLPKVLAVLVVAAFLTAGSEPVEAAGPAARDVKPAAQSLPINEVREDGFVPNWHVMVFTVNPEADRNRSEEKFVASFRKDYLAALGGQAKAALAEGVTVSYKDEAGRERTAKVEVSMTDSISRLASGRQGGHMGRKIAYANCLLKSDKDQTVTCYFGSDDEAMVWVNGKLVHETYVPRSFHARTDKFSVDLKAGLNPLMVKTSQRSLSWVFALEVEPIGPAAAKELVLHFQPEIRHQTFEGWGVLLDCRAFDTWIRTVKDGEKTSREEMARLYDAQPAPSQYSQKLSDAIAADLVERGFNRFRLEVGPQVEFINDNDDPHRLNMEAFRFKWQDLMIREQLLPAKKLLDERGEPMVLYVSYDLRSSLSAPWQLEPEEYAEMAVATLRHLKDKWNLEPKYWSVINEPGNYRPGDPKLCARLTFAVGKRIAEAGFRTKMSGPECVTPGQVDKYMKGMIATPGALDRYAQLTYHLYWDPDTIKHRLSIRKWAEKLKVTAAQTEWMEQTDLDVARHIVLDLTLCNVVTWERYGWAIEVDTGKQTFQRDSTAWYIRQYSRFIRPGAVRVEITDPPTRFVRPVAFLSPKNKPVIVVSNEDKQPRKVRFENLPAGKYMLSVVPDEKGAKVSEVQVPRSGVLAFSLPARSVITLTADPPAPGPVAP